MAAQNGRRGGELVSDLSALIFALRESGAVRVRVGDVEVYWSAPPTVAREADAPLSHEERSLRVREDEESILFAASG